MALGLAIGSWLLPALEGTSWRRSHLLPRLTYSRRYVQGDPPPPPLTRTLLSAAWRPGRVGVAVLSTLHQLWPLWSQLPPNILRPGVPLTVPLTSQSHLQVFPTDLGRDSGPSHSQMSPLGPHTHLKPKFPTSLLRCHTPQILPPAPVVPYV